MVDEFEWGIPCNVKNLVRCLGVVFQGQCESGGNIFGVSQLDFYRFAIFIKGCNQAGGTGKNGIHPLTFFRSSQRFPELGAKCV